MSEKQEFEELAKTLEDLLDEYATKESTSYEVRYFSLCCSLNPNLYKDLLPIYTRAMELEFAFFDAQVGQIEDSAQSGLHTLTEHDTTETIVQVIILIGCDLAPEQSVKTGWQSLQDEQTLEARKQTLNHVSESFYDQYKKTIDRLLKENKPTTGANSYDPQALRNFFDGLAAFDKWVQSLSSIELSCCDRFAPEKP
eukprot:747034-Hanusia_phi.AAC.5